MSTHAGESPASVLTGRRFGVFEVDDVIGTGGMGEVYRAHDTKLNRDVAIKVLPAALRIDAERLARLDQEAQVLAALNHPNIATIHGVEDALGVRALVLELVEEPTLAEYLARRPLPVDEALPLARQIVQGLKAAHERGIIHRDLKPANVKLRPDGVIKLLDFGLAKLCQSDFWGRDLSEAPTLTAAGTREGVVKDTPAYMSPEQASGADVDERTDIWAFGCVLYRMVSGRETFPGRTASEIITAILEQEPDWTALPIGAPAPLRRLLRRCLERDRRRRRRDLGEALADLDEAADPRMSDVQNAKHAGSRHVISSGRVASTAITAAAIIVTALLWLQPREASAPVTRFTIPAPSGFQTTAAVPALSPDGQTLVFSLHDLRWRGPRQLGYRRRLDEFHAAGIPDAKGAFAFFFSPDGRSMGFCTREGLKKISPGGGAPVTLYEGTVIGADWGPDETIVFASESGLMRMSAAGGKPQLLTSPPPGKLHVWPAILPGGGGVVFTEWEGPPATGTGQIAAVSFDRGVERVLLKGSGLRLSPTGHLIFARDGSLWAAPFDEHRLTVTGEAVPVMDGPTFQAQRQVVFTSGPPFSLLSKPADGGASPRLIVTANFAGAVAASDWSRDGETIVFSYLATPRLGDNPAFDIGVVSADGQKAWTPLLHSDAAEVDPAISPAGTRIAYSSNRPGRFEIYVERFPELGDRQVVSNNGGVEPLWAPNGKEIFYRSLDRREMVEVPFDPTSGSLGRATTLFQGSYASYLSGLPFRSYDLTPDGERFVMLKDAPDKNRGVAPTELKVVLNWSQELTREAPVK